MQAGGPEQPIPEGPAPGPQQQAAGPQAALAAEQVDALVRQRLDQALSSVFSRLLDSSEKAAQAAEKQASVAATTTWSGA